MIDFIEYVVAELKSKRLSKSNAAALVRQFSRRGTGAATASLHPLLHRNTSDLGEQRFTSAFTGDESFLADHRVGANKVLPGVAYLEMARAAIEHALPERPKLVELRNVVWAQPVIVSGKQEVSIALLAAENDAIDFEVFSSDDTVHCQGRAIVAPASPERVDLESLARRMTRGSLDAHDVYETCARMGLHYGPSFRSVQSIARGDGQLLAKLRMPQADSESVLPPSLLDGALQACIGLMETAEATPRVPFALDALRMFAPCPGEVTVWVRYAPGSSAADSVVKVDLDLCDERGNVCVQLRGFTSRVMGTASGVVYATPTWVADDRTIDFAEQHVIRCEGGDFTEHAIVCFERIQQILRNMPQGRVLLQIVIDDESLAGLGGLLRTASLENPQLIGQLVIGGEPRMQRWQEVTVDGDAPVAFKEGGLYLITGGRGALGTLFAREIERCGAKAIQAGRADFDLLDRASVQSFIDALLREHGRLDGILHAAGTTADEFLLRKDAATFRNVLAPKVTGTVNLDEATKDVPLDFFVLFAALAGSMGNVGQSDYATANAFLDAFAAQRNRRVASGERHGRTRAIDWPLWQDGGMQPDAASRERLREATGMHAMQTATGIAAFHRALALPHDQLLVVEGDAAQIRRSLLSAAKPETPAPVATTLDAESTEEFLRNEFAEVLKVPPATIDARAALELYGIDSILAMKLTNRLEQTFGSLPKTLFFEYQTLRELASYFAANHATKLTTPNPQPQTQTVAPPPTPDKRRRTLRHRITKQQSPSPTHEPIAIIGLSGRYPQAFDVDAYWTNLRDGRDCITEVPKSRWDWREYYTEDRTRTGRHYSKWGGFIEGVDEFDPLFFNISPVDAELIDPQERLFLQHAWMALEDAGYTRASLQQPAENDLPGQAGVYAGVMYTEYQLFGTRQRGLVGSFASVANRVSYALNLHGPSMTIDTMCSSSLTAIHIACQDLEQGRTSLAIAGGVNVTVHPNKYLILSDGQFISGDGHCQSFGEGGDGYIPGEGVGVVILKRLSDAERDGDHIYGVIRGSALNHGGKTNGYSVPNPQAQSTAISRALAEAKIDARHVSYVEAHGTGTKLGDPIEIAALHKAFGQHTQDTQFCLIGSAKSNVGHCESAAGIAGLTKVLLQMQHGQIVPSLHSAQLNPHIDFAKTPFTVNQELRPWLRPIVAGRTVPRIAGISSFGAGGSNAHMIVEEYVWSAATPVAAVPQPIVVSARTPEQLDRKVRDLLTHLRKHPDLPLASIAYTLQTGREPMDERLAFIVSSAGELAEKLEAILGGNLAGVHRGQAKRNNETLALFANDADLQQAIDRWIAARKLPRLLDLWVKGLDVDWTKLHTDARPRRISLPVYPFARDRYWIDGTSSAADANPVATQAVLHPLLHANTSDLSEQRYTSSFTGDEFFLADHLVSGSKVLPGVAVLEMARAAVARATHRDATLELRNTVWAQPVVVNGRAEVHLALIANDDDTIDYELYSGDDTIHAQGQAAFAAASAQKVDLDALRARMTANARTPEDLYAAYARMGLEYGPAFRTIRSIQRGHGEVLAALHLSENTAAGFVLHPSVMDGALQSGLGLLDGDAEARVPFALDTLRVLAPCTTEMFAWVRTAANDKVDVDLCDASGNVCVQLHGFTTRVLAARTGLLTATAVWEASEAGREETFAEEHLVLCELPAVGEQSTVLRAEGTPAQRYTEYAAQCFARIQSILQRRPQHRVLFRVVVAEPLLAGLAALLQTASLENPHFAGQLLLVDAQADVTAILRNESASDPVVRYDRGTRQVQRLREVSIPDAPVAFKDDGVYLITGGRGALGSLFANEILARTKNARVILTGRAPATTPPVERITHHAVDLTSLEDVTKLIAGIHYEHHRLDGILHCAGMVADHLIAGKSADEFRGVLAPKVTGTEHLDQASRFAELDFFVLFSSLAGAAGNAGQADYATANAFLDRFAAQRNALVATGERRGRTLSIDWPQWQDGGMDLDPSRRDLLEQTLGLHPLQTATGLQAFHRGLASQHDQLLVVEGDVAKLRRTLLTTPAAAPRAEAAATAGDASLVEKTRDYLRKELASLLKMPAQKIDPLAPLEDYGIDSILAMKLTNQLEKTFGSLSKTLFFEYQTIHDLAGYFSVQHATRLASLFTTDVKPAPQSISTTIPPKPTKTRRSRTNHQSPITTSAQRESEIAIIGLSGRYPQAFDVAAYWRNLRDGKDCITEVPKSRWDWREYLTETGGHRSKWGGFIEGVDEFDPLFFHMTPLEAEFMDPQERLFLEHVWMAMEDAGYTRAGLQTPIDDDLPGQVGVYAGVMYSEYQLFGAEAGARGERLGLPGSTASIANRVSYALNLHGPSVTLDTMCSSSLTAIHFACQDLRLGRTNVAIAGGVNVTIHPNKYLVLSAGQFISGDGHCQSFGEGGDGYIPGEGVGVVLLKRLADARRDGDHIYGIIRGSALNHGGKTNGYTVPNPQAQAAAIRRALTESHTDARHVSYIEAHGTGTKLGDPIEIAALNKAFGRDTQETQFCRIGSAKSNIGHCESAAGIAGVTKVLLQMQHKEIVPSLHSAQLNPNIDFPASPFIVNQELRPWDAPVVDGRTLQRIAGISSFGAGGSNAHVILEEYVAPARAAAADAPHAILLSARTPEQLQQKIADLLAFVREHQSRLDLASIAYTLQAGRESMDERLGFIAASIEDLIAQLEHGLADAYRGRVQRNAGLSLFSTDADLLETVDKWLAHGKLANLLDLWTKGLDPDWSRLYNDPKPQRVSLPVYPFARERYWIDTRASSPATRTTARLHPLLHSNTSDLSEQRYGSTFTGAEFFLADHQVQGRKILPAVAYLEMVRAAIADALPGNGEALELRDTVFAQPVIVDAQKEVRIGLSPQDSGEIDYAIYTVEGDDDVVHCEGRAQFHNAVAEQLDVAALRTRMTGALATPAEIYATSARLGLAYGPAFHSIVSVARGENELLAQLRIPANAADDAYVLHPSLLDGALQSCVAFLTDSTELRIPFALDTLRVFAPCTAEMHAWVRQTNDKLDIDLADAAGNVCVQFRGLTTRTVTNQSRITDHLFATPAWQESAIAATREIAQRHVIVCDPQDGTIAQRYTSAALACFERLCAILESKPQSRVLVQIAVPHQPEQTLFAGLAALAQTAMRENPHIAAQVVLLPPNESIDAILDAEQRAADVLVRYTNGKRHVLRWEEITAPSDAPIAFKDGGVYLITGGLGALGVRFAKEILERTRDSHVVLTGRSPLRADTALFEGLFAQNGRVSFHQLHLGDFEQVAQLIASIRDHYGRLDGILHSAGMIADNFIIRKDAAEFLTVLEPKVTGTFHLDKASHDVDLDFFVLFSSVAGATGNAGQADYAAANSFMDRFAAHRNALVASGLRKGRTRSINWPLWQAGGMSLDPATQELLAETTGMRPMATATGMDAFQRILALPHDEMLVAEGDLPKMRRVLVSSTTAPETQPAPVVSIDTENLQTRVQDYLRREFSGILKLPYQKIDAEAALEHYGIDSILAMKLTSQLEKTFGALSKTLFFEYQTVAALARYFIVNHAAQLAVVVPSAGAPAVKVAPPPPPKSRARRRAFARARQEEIPIAIIGLSGRYPQANNLREFWRNLRNGRDCITEIPSDRWNHDLYFDANPGTPGKSYSKWGGFLSDVDKFDPLFFSISPKEAELLDPQERLFLETAWETIEDAGYTKESVAGASIGVYAGVMWGQYELYGADAMAHGAAAFPGSSYASIANRVSYFFDFHGPSIALDTMCSSSLTAIHLACDALRKGEIDAAIAGGVNVTVHPYKYLSLSQGKFAATDGRCRAFGAGGDGYVPGEGVGAVLLKPLDAALRDGDQIYATIKATAVNHGGKTNGYSVPNPNAQGDLIANALRKANVDPRTLSYIETHGTGTSLGDPIEITGLTKAFGATDEKQFCPIGSVKSNIGHLESAAGIASITKALLQLSHNELVPSLHASPLNPNIDFESSPFYVQTELAPWTRPDDRPRRIGVSSFGAGGSNAHVILEEFVAPVRNDIPSSQPEAFLLSAKDDAALRRYAQRIVDSLDAVSDLSISDVAYTSQVGRTPMDARLVILTSGITDLREKLTQWLDGAREIDDVFHGNVRDAQSSARQLFAGQTGAAFVGDLLAKRDLEKIANLWILGVPVEWSRLHSDAQRRRVSLPTYPFARERHWITTAAAPVPVRTPVPVPDDKRRTYHVPEWTPKAIGARGELAPGTIVLIQGAELQLDGVDVQTVGVGLLPLFERVRELLKANAPLRIISVISHPLDAAIAGFLRTVTLENPRCSAKVIDGAPANLIDEIHEAHWTDLEIRYRDGVRFTSELRERAITPRAELPLRHKGVYLITGGMGGLGLIFAEYLAKQSNARLVLVGRSAADEAKLRELEALGAEVLHVRADVAKREDVDRVVAAAKARFGVIHGVLHSAGVNRDALVLRKTVEDIEAVLAPKVHGAKNLDEATANEALDFFVLFSSIAAVIGNPGQSDYAYANRYLDAFAEQRAQTRRGRTLSINWPFWANGGMEMSPENIARLEQQTGMAPLPTSEGIRAFEELLRSDLTRGVVLYGKVKPKRAARGESLEARTEGYLKELLGAELKLSADRIGSNDPLESYGIDSVMISKLNTQLEHDLGALPKTLFYEHETVRALTTFLVAEAREALVKLFGTVAEDAPVVETVRVPERIVEVRAADEPIAIIGVHGWYPQSPNLESYWDNLRNGRDLIDLVPADRWNYEELYHPDPAAAADGKVYCKWGGFIADHDKFDPHFFKIPTTEARLIDPQERLFLESVWAAIEDAGYTRETLRAKHGKAGSANVGVYVGVTTNTYQLWAPEERGRGNFVAPTAMPWSIANRVSYFFDFNGPSLPVDTACSSSLVAMHLACESLRSGECQVAIAGGVNLYLHPAKYHSLCSKRMVSQDGKTRSYGAGDDGFVPGEGVGTIVLKPLAKAVADGDHVYATIRASAFDHSGRSNGYSAPNPNAQANLISRTLEKAGIHPESISYIEGHGTGTQLGDSLEIAALTNAFRRHTAKKQFCPIGSVKANLGHSESAAGIAGVAKVLLQLEHRQLAPSIHSENVNPNIEFDESPFYLQHALSEWTSDGPRRALVNSFGAGGVNACVVIEEYESPRAAATQHAGPYLFTLSAKNEERLREYAGHVAARLYAEPNADLASFCYTYQSGRESMDARLATVVGDVRELADRLSDWSDRGWTAGVQHGTLGPRRGARRSVKLSLGEQSLDELAAKWIAGEDVDWDSLYPNGVPARVSAPTYPFARERYWVSDDTVAPAPAQSVAQLHPLVAYNSSTLKEVSFTSMLSDDAFYAVDHKVHDTSIFPGAGFLEMACIAANVAGEQRVRKIKDVVWIAPLAFRNGPQSLRTVLRHAGETVEYAVASLDDDNEPIVHSEGRLAFVGGGGEEERVAIQELKARCEPVEEGAAFYDKFREFGLQYGPSFRTVQELYVGGAFALAKLKIAEPLRGDFSHYILHPSIIDGALQTVAGLVTDTAARTPYVPFALDEVEILAPLPQICWAYAERAGESTQGYAGVTKFNIRLLSESGEVLIRFTNLYVRPLPQPAAVLSVSEESFS